MVSTFFTSPVSWSKVSISYCLATGNVHGDADPSDQWPTITSRQDIYRITRCSRHDPWFVHQCRGGLLCWSTTTFRRVSELVHSTFGRAFYANDQQRDLS